MLFCSDLERQVDAHESQLVEIDQQQKHLLANVRKETELLEEQRKMLSDELGKNGSHFCPLYCICKMSDFPEAFGQKMK